MSNRRFRLKRLEATAWRGIRDPLSIPLDKPLNVIYGPNGSGKSSLVTAIEWALFPAESQRLRDHQIDERRDWEIRHVHGLLRPDVTLTMSAGKQEFPVHQTGIARGPATATYADFKGMAFLHQETLRDFLVGTAAPRQAALHRLLGVGWAQDLAKVFAEAAKQLAVNDADRHVQQLEDQLHVRLLEARRQAEQLERDASAAGLEPPWPEAEARLTASLEAMRAGGAAVGVGGIHAQAARRTVEIESLRAAWKSSADLARQAADSLPPEPESFDEALRQGAARREDLRARLSALDRHQALLRDTLAHLRLHAETSECPVCRQPVSQPSLLRDIESRVGVTLSGEEAVLRRQLEETEAALREANNQRAAAAERRNARNRADHAVERIRAAMQTALGRSFTLVEDPEAVATREIARLQADVARQQKALASAQERLAAIEKESTRLDLVRRLIAAWRRIRQLEDLRETPAWTALLDSHRRLAVGELLLEHSAAAVRQHAAALAARNLDRARAPISYIYSQLTCRKDFPRVVIDPEQKFEIAIAGPAGGHAATGVLNLTDLNCLALAVTAGMAVAFPEAHDLEFLILDDPSQSMDSSVAPRLAPILARLAAKLQIVIATPDAVLVKALRRTAVYKNIITLEPRDPEDEQPSVHVASVEH